MSEHGLLDRKTFSFENQRQFAQISGDHNPLHLDPIAARRTQAGAPLVHGIHLLLWALDAFAASGAMPAALCKAKVRFTKFVYVGECAEVALAEQSATGAKLTISVGGTAVCQVTIGFGAAKPEGAMPDETLPFIALPVSPRDMEFEQMTETSGHLPFAMSPDAVAKVFPTAAEWIGPRRVAALAATSNLVGMVCPGLHSIYSSLTFDACDDAALADRLDFRVASTDPRFRRVTMAIAGGGLMGSIDAFARVPPTPQATMAAVAHTVESGEFSGSTALIIGGSRGIGELTAKLVASGGGKVIISYAVGKDDASKVADEINAGGHVCDVIAYDVRTSPAEQLVNLTHVPTHLYYFATPAIFGRTSNSFSRERLDAFMEVYVDGFWKLVETLRERYPKLSVFYPSSVAVDQRPKGMTEYAMAKAAGEILCASINQTLAPVRVIVSRLPRMETDQTATFMPVDSSSALDTMLPLIRQVQSNT